MRKVYKRKYFENSGSTNKKTGHYYETFVEVKKECDNYEITKGTKVVDKGITLPHSNSVSLTFHGEVGIRALYAILQKMLSKKSQ